MNTKKSTNKALKTAQRVLHLGLHTVAAITVIEEELLRTTPCVSKTVAGYWIHLGTAHAYHQDPQAYWDRACVFLLFLLEALEDGSLELADLIRVVHANIEYADAV